MRRKPIPMSSVKRAKVPEESLALDLRTVITPYHIDDREVTSDESDSDDSAVRLALSEASFETDESDHELQAEIHGDAVRQQPLEQPLVDPQERPDSDEEDDHSLRIAPFLLHGLTVPQNHDYSGALAEAEADNERVTNDNVALITEGWLQMIKEIGNNTTMCKTFITNYTGRTDLTIKQVLTWIENNHDKFKRFQDVDKKLTQLQKELTSLLNVPKSPTPMEAKIQNQEKFLKNKVRLHIQLGKVWNPTIQKKTTPALKRATRMEFSNYLTSKIQWAVKYIDDVDKLWPAVQVWLQKGIKNQLLFEDLQQEVSEPSPQTSPKPKTKGTIIMY